MANWNTISSRYSGRHAGLDQFRHHVERFRRQPPGTPHALEGFGSVDRRGVVVALDGLGFVNRHGQSVICPAGRTYVFPRETQGFAHQSGQTLSRPQDLRGEAGNGRCLRRRRNNAKSVPRRAALARCPINASSHANARHQALRRLRTRRPRRPDPREDPRCRR